MRTIRRTTAFKRDYRREKKSRHARTLDEDLRKAVALLAEDRVLARRYDDHALAGERKDHRDCHVRPGLLLIYRKPDTEHLDLVRLGSHSELGL